MNIILIFAVIFGAMIAQSFWEAYVEGRNAWDKGKLGWKIKFSKHNTLSAYRFFIFFIMWPLLLSLPFIIYGWNLKLFGVIVSAFFSGIVIEDFMWFVLNPVVSLKEFNPKFASYYPWIKIGKFEIPVYYVIDLSIAFFSWIFIWK